MLHPEPDEIVGLEPGQQLRRIRERLQLKYRDVEEASARIAQFRGDEQFQVGLSRLADIENRGTVPSIYRVYSLCAIYRLNFRKVLAWYGVDFDRMEQDVVRLPLERTNLMENGETGIGTARVPLLKEDLPDLEKTLYLTKQVVRWGRLPVSLLEGLDLEHQRYGFIGLNDWFMYPIIRPGSFVQIDESRRKLSFGSWANEWERPIYLVESRDGYRCGWCSIRGETLILQPHPAANVPAETFKVPVEAEVVGQVTGIAMRLYPGPRHRTRSATDQE